MDVTQRVKKPAIGLIVLSVCNVLIWLRLFRKLITHKASGWEWTTEHFSAEWINVLFLYLPNLIEIETMSPQPVLLFLKFGIVLNLILFYGAAHMMAGKRYYLSYSCSILAVTPILSPLFVLGIPIGAWCLYTLNDREVAAAMKRSEFQS